MAARSEPLRCCLPGAFYFLQRNELPANRIYCASLVFPIAIATDGQSRIITVVANCH